MDELPREGARRIVRTTLWLEVEQSIQALHHVRDEHGHTVVVVRSRRSHHERTVNLGPQLGNEPLATVLDELPK